jgi:hypothetical protein
MTPDPISPAFVQQLRTLAYVEGKNFVLEQKSAEGKFVSSKVDVIVTSADAITRTAKAVTRETPPRETQQSSHPACAK